MGLNGARLSAAGNLRRKDRRHMTIEEFRKRYPFIAYGEEYATWGEQRKWYKWLYNQLHTERPTSSTCHEWRRLHWTYKTALDEYEKAFKVLPKPTKEQHNRRYDKDVVGKWPEEAIEDIKEFLNEASYCNDVAKDVAAIITENNYHINVLKEKTYESTKDMEKGRKKRK